MHVADLEPRDRFAQAAQARERRVGRDDESCGPRELDGLAAGGRAQVRDSRIHWKRRVLSYERGRRILHEEQSLLERPEFAKPHAPADHETVAHERRILHHHARRFEHRLELLAHHAERPDDERSLMIVRLEQGGGFFRAPPRHPARDEPPRMRELQRQRGHGIGWNLRAEIVPFAVEPAQHGVRELARTDPVALLREFDGLRDGRIRRYAPHMEQLVRAEPQQVGQVGVEAHQAATHALAEQGVEPAPAAQHPIEKLLGPAAIARVQGGGPAIERGVEQHTRAQVGQRLRRGDSRVGYACSRGCC